MDMEYDIVDIFSSAGGISLGFQDGGGEVVVAVELCTKSAATYGHNFPAVGIISRDIRTVEQTEIANILNKRINTVFSIIGGPPCQGFSESNKRTRSLENEKNHLHLEFLRFVKDLQPRWFVMENVEGLTTFANGKILKDIIEVAKRLGYNPQYKILNAADFGVPQHRHRVFIIGNNVGIDYKFPEPTYGDGKKPYITVKQAIGDLPIIENGASEDYFGYRLYGNTLSKYQKEMRANKNGTGKVQGNLVTRNSDLIIERYKHIKPGQNWEAIPEELMGNYTDRTRCHSGIYYRLKWDEPARTIGNYRKNMLIHPEQDRGLSVREAARLQSFPDDFEFKGSIGFQQQQVADAVPPLLAKAVAKSILDAERKAEKD